MTAVAWRGDLVRSSATGVRVAAVVMSGVAMPFVVGRFPQPWLALALYAVLVVMSALVVVAPRLMAVELVVGVAVLLANGWLISDEYAGTWVFFAYPHTVMITFAVGVASRGLVRPALTGTCWALAYVTVAHVAHGAPLAAAFAATPTYLANPVVGALSAKVFRRNTRELEEARAAAVEHAALLAVRRVRERAAWALHDRVLQTLEALARGAQVTDAALRRRVVTEAVWLRAFVESGSTGQSHDLTSGLDAVARMVGDLGLRVEVNYAAFLRDAAEVPLTVERRIAMVEAVYAVLEAMAGAVGEVVVQARPDRDGVVVSVFGLSEEDSSAPVECPSAAARLAEVGGRLEAAADTPYVELWVPVGGM